ncbi:hypothetical protein A2U01_0071405, partial [Trifolium medium]|nr:hypothetical protein [Trifolium medium]
DAGPSGGDDGEIGDDRPCIPRFRRSWSRHHFKRKSRVYSFELAELNPADSVLRGRLDGYFKSLGKSRSGADRFIDTKDILRATDCEHRAVLF